jgi:hypothetical protein
MSAERAREIEEIRGRSFIYSSPLDCSPLDQSEADVVTLLRVIDEKNAEIAKLESQKHLPYGGQGCLPEGNEAACVHCENLEVRRRLADVRLELDQVKLDYEAASHLAATSGQVWRDVSGELETVTEAANALGAENERFLAWQLEGARKFRETFVDAYPFGGLLGLLGELETSLKGHGARCWRPEECGPTGCLLAKIWHVRRTLSSRLSENQSTEKP